MGGDSPIGAVAGGVVESATAMIRAMPGARMLPLRDEPTPPPGVRDLVHDLADRTFVVTVAPSSDPQLAAEHWWPSVPITE